MCDPIVTQSVPMSRITAETLKRAVRDASAEKSWEETDSQCPGLQLRVRGGAVTWTVRARLLGRQRRWPVGDHDTRPDDARARAVEVKA